jgi:hypothetical protein
MVVVIITFTLDFCCFDRANIVKEKLNLFNPMGLSLQMAVTGRYWPKADSRYLRIFMI